MSMTSQAKQLAQEAKNLSRVDYNEISNTITNAAGLINDISQQYANKKATEWTDGYTDFMNKKMVEPDFYKDEDGYDLDADGMSAKIEAMVTEYQKDNPMPKGALANKKIQDFLEEKNPIFEINAHANYIANKEAERKEEGEKLITNYKNLEIPDYMMYIQTHLTEDDISSFTEEEMSIFSELEGGQDNFNYINAKTILTTSGLRNLGYSNAEILKNLPDIKRDIAKGVFVEAMKIQFADVIDGSTTISEFKNDVYESINEDVIPGLTKEQPMNEVEKSQLYNDVMAVIEPMYTLETEKQEAIFNEEFIPKLIGMERGTILTTETLNNLLENTKGLNKKFISASTLATLYDSAKWNDAVNNAYNATVLIDAIDPSLPPEEKRAEYRKISSELSGLELMILLGSVGEDGEFFDGSFSDFTDRTEYLMQFGKDYNGNVMKSGFASTSDYAYLSEKDAKEKNEKVIEASEEISEEALYTKYETTRNGNIDLGDFEAATNDTNSYWEAKIERNTEKLRSEDISEDAIATSNSSLKEQWDADIEAIKVAENAYNKDLETKINNLLNNTNNETLANDLSVAVDNKDSKEATRIAKLIVNNSRKQALEGVKDQTQIDSINKEYDELGESWGRYYANEQKKWDKETADKVAEIVSSIEDKQDAYDLEVAIANKDVEAAIKVVTDQNNRNRIKDLEGVTDQAKIDEINATYAELDESVRSYYESMGKEWRDELLDEIKTDTYETTIEALNDRIEAAKNEKNANLWQNLEILKYEEETKHTVQGYLNEGFTEDSKEVQDYIASRAAGVEAKKEMIAPYRKQWEQEAKEEAEKQEEEAIKLKDAAILNNAHEVETAIIYDLVNDIDLTPQERDYHSALAYSTTYETLKTARDMDADSVIEIVSSMPDYLNQEWNSFFNANKESSDLGYAEMFGAWYLQKSYGVENIDVSSNWIDNVVDECFDNALERYQGFTDRNSSKSVDGVSVGSRYENRKKGIKEDLKTAQEGVANPDNQYDVEKSRQIKSNITTAYLQGNMTLEDAYLEAFNNKSNLTTDDWEYIIDTLDGDSIPYLKELDPNFNAVSILAETVPLSSGYSADSYFSDTAVGKLIMSNVSDLIIQGAGRLMAKDPGYSLEQLKNDIINRSKEIQSQASTSLILMGFSENNWDNSDEAPNATSSFKSIKGNASNAEDWYVKTSNSVLSSYIIDAVDDKIVNQSWDAAINGNNTATSDSYQGFMECEDLSRPQLTTLAFGLAMNMFYGENYSLQFTKEYAENLSNVISPILGDMDLVDNAIIAEVAMYLITKKNEYDMASDSNAPIGYYSGKVAVSGYPVEFEHDKNGKVDSGHILVQTKDGTESYDLIYTTDKGIKNVSKALQALPLHGIEGNHDDTYYDQFPQAGLTYDELMDFANECPEFVEATKVIEYTQPDKTLVPYINYHTGNLTCALVDKGNDEHITQICYSAFGNLFSDLLVDVSSMAWSDQKNYKSLDTYKTAQKYVNDLTYGAYKLELEGAQYNKIKIVKVQNPSHSDKQIKTSNGYMVRK